MSDGKRGVESEVKTHILLGVGDLPLASWGAWPVTASQILGLSTGWTAQVQEGQPHLSADPGSAALVILAHLVTAMGRYVFDA